ncbi:tax1-binding protein 1 homolog B isoform X2 [Myxocyprinus asiaticus]|uniref:tax1-binding protein 1 homolog B isoform X2 n=1 Tax=Myxocyprinus asiaticus TaxID=70543 RepID=UPI0022236DFB|nr:tax1-binding protein 1 homolog B isoform X2 [Myxocyprinus asiaticus]
MALFLEGTVASSAMETSNFAHVIFQNMGKSYLPHSALECHYTLTQFIKPHPKDWVGIFKVGWSTARDYYTFLWSPLPDNYTEGTAVNRSVVFQGYYVPNDDGEFYQFCYVTHKGEIRGASTPFQFRANSPTEEELMTMEDEGGSDILVVTTKASYLEQKIEQIQQEKKELLDNLDLLQKEKEELIEEKNRLQKEYEQEQEGSAQLRKDVQELHLSAQSLQEEREVVKRRMEESTARLLQLEEDLIGVTQKGLQKETELDCLKDRVKKLTLEKEALECQLKNEKDEKELYKIHLKNRELENTKLSAELQMLKSVDVNKENTIAQLKEELTRFKACLAEKDKQHHQLLANSSPSKESLALREQLRRKEEQLRDYSSAHDRSMAELYRVRLEVESFKKGQAEAQAQCSHLEKQLEEMKKSIQQKACEEQGEQHCSENMENTIAQLKEELTRVKACLADKDKQHRQLLASSSPSGESKALREQLRQKEEQLQATQQQVNMLSAELRDSSNARDRSMAELYRVRLEAESLKKGQAEARAECSHLEKQLEEMKNSTQQEAELEGSTVTELQREVEDLRLRLQMAAEHYKDKYKECQKLQKQVTKLSEQQGVKRSPGSETATGSLSASPESSAPGSPGTSDAVLDAIIQCKLKTASKEPDKNDKYRKCKQMLSEERERCSMMTDELTKMEVKLKEQIKTNESLRMQLAAEEDRYKSQIAEKGREMKELKDSLVALTKEKEKLEGELQRSVSREEENGKKDGNLDVQSVFLQYPMPYPQDDPSPLLVPQRPADLMFDNPYSSADSRDGADGEFSDDQMPRLPPVGPPSWDSNVVCIQPSRNLSRPDGLEEPEEPQTTQTNDQPTASDPTEFLSDGQMPFCFESGGEQQKRCPLCEVIFPPHYDQSKFEEHVESHWKICPMCSEQFPLDCDQQLFEKHVLTHFDSNVLNF